VELVPFPVMFVMKDPLQERLGIEFEPGGGAGDSAAGAEAL